jgi:hypothetical protein
MDSETPKPTIDPESPKTSRSQPLERIPKRSKKDQSRVYYMMRKFRQRQEELLGTENIEDPDPFEPTYIFYCFQGRWEK